ncbi:MAG: metallophosphoesterase [Candidatus Odinarchaeota archaeon]
MKILIVHISDIHFKNKDNSILEKKEQICKAFQNEALEVENLFMAISGDIAFSGKKTEYKQAIELFDSIKTNIEEYSQKAINWVIVPGNHDCDFGRGNKTVREIVIEKIQQDGDKAVDEGVITQCCEPQNNFLKFLKSYNGNDNIVYSDKLLRIIEYNFDNFNIVFNCYNTPWISQLHEKPGTMYFPTQCYPRKYVNHKANLVISLLHHSFNWQNPENSRALRQHIEGTSDIILTGHEHIASKSNRGDLEGNYTEFIEGAVLQESDNDEDSGFNVILVDLENENQKILNYTWNGKRYSLVNQNTEWFSYRRSKQLSKPIFRINSKFQASLNDVGASFTHPNKSELTLEDFFIYPDLRELRINERTEEDKLVLDSIVNSDVLCEINEVVNKVLLVGDDKSGKTSLCKVLYKHYYESGYVPVYIEGNKIRSTSIERFNKLLARCYAEQYSDDTLEMFTQLENGKKLLIIDDFDQSKLNIKYKHVLVNRVNEHYPNTIITGNDFFQIGEMLYEEEQKENGGAFENYKQFEIREFGNLLRSKLINTWNTLGQEEIINDCDLVRKNDYVKRIVNTIIGNHLVPSYPIFLLTIFQTIEAGTPHDLKESIYSYYYEYLITDALIKTDIQHDELDAYHCYITELSYYFFKKEIHE